MLQNYEMMARGIRIAGVKQYSVFCAADFWSSLAYDPPEQKQKTLPNSRIPDTSNDGSI